MTQMLDQAERNDDGDLIWERTIPAVAGGTTEIETNVTKLLTPGERKTGTVEHLVIEAKLYDERSEQDWGGNPATPVNAEVAKEAIEKIDRLGLEPAWRLVDNAGEFP